MDTLEPIPEELRNLILNSEDYLKHCARDIVKWQVQEKVEQIKALCRQAQARKNLITDDLPVDVKVFHQIDVENVKKEMIFEQNSFSTILYNTYSEGKSGRIFDKVSPDTANKNTKVRGAYARAKARERAGRHYARIGKEPFWPTSSSVDPSRPAPKHKPKAKQDPGFKRRRCKANKQIQKRKQPCAYRKRSKKSMRYDQCLNIHEGEEDRAYDEEDLWSDYESDIRLHDQERYSSRSTAAYISGVADSSLVYASEWLDSGSPYLDSASGVVDSTPASTPSSSRARPLPVIPKATGPPRKNVSEIDDINNLVDDEDPWSKLEFGLELGTDSMTYPLMSTSPVSASFIGITLSPAMSQSDTAAQHGVMGQKAFRAHKATLWKRYGLKAINPTSDINPVESGGAYNVIGRCAFPAGIAHMNGVIMYSILVEDSVPPLTQISTLNLMGAIIDFSGRICAEAVTKISTIPTGHRQHSLLEFTAQGWTAPPDMAHLPF